MIFSTQVHGIPCQCQVKYFAPARRYTGHGNEGHPPEKGDFAFELLDRKGYRASWLEKYLKDDDRQRLLDEYEASYLADQYDIHF